MVMRIELVNLQKAFKQCLIHASVLKNFSFVLMLSFLNDIVRNEKDVDVLSRNNMLTPQFLVGILDEMATFPENPFFTI